LLLVEDGEVVGLDVAESYFVAHFSTPGQACRSISLFALSDVRSRQCTKCRPTFGAQRAPGGRPPKAPRSDSGHRPL
jgi:hypothetical protein